MNNDSNEIDEQAYIRAQDLIGLAWHAGAYLTIGILLISLDLLGSGELNWSFWILCFWGFGLAFHVLYYLINGTKLEQRLAEKYAQNDRRRKDHNSNSDGGVNHS